MSQAANVRDVEVIQEFHDTLQRFRHDAVKAMDSVAMEIRRTFDWIDDQLKFWQGEIRRREDDVTLAKAELAQRKMVKFFGRVPDTSQQEKALRIARERLEEAQEKLETTRRWLPEWQRAVDDYQAPARQLSGALEADVPRALQLLLRKVEALEAYLALSAPTTSPVPPASPQQGDKS